MALKMSGKLNWVIRNPAGLMRGGDKIIILGVRGRQIIFGVQGGDKLFLGCGEDKIIILGVRERQNPIKYGVRDEYGKVR